MIIAVEKIYSIIEELKIKNLLLEDYGMSTIETKPLSGKADEPTSGVGAPSALLINELEWTDSEVKDSYYRLKHLEEDWNAPEMDVYDEL